MNNYLPYILLITMILVSQPGEAFSRHTYSDEGMYLSESVNIKNVNGRFYAYVVLLFNENPHFVNLIQKDSVPLKVIGTEGFHIKEYREYLSSLHDHNLKKLATELLELYLNSYNLSETILRKYEDTLLQRNIIIRFSRERVSHTERIGLDYCIYGKKTSLSVKHPFLEHDDVYYNVRPFIYYDEFSTSNSTFYYDMIYINPSEVRNDSQIASKVLRGESTGSHFFVGSRVTADIRYCLNRAFPRSASISDEIWHMFVVHELTHKILNNRFNYFDQIAGEELSLSSTIYENPMLGLAVMYSYLNYSSVNPHRLAAMNFVRYISKATGDASYENNPSKVKHLDAEDLKKLARSHFFKLMKELDQK